MSTQTTAPTGIPAFPTHRADLDITFPDNGSEAAVVRLPEGRYLRLGQDAAKILQTLDGTRTREAVVEALGTQHVDALTATRLLEQFTAAGLLDRPAAPRPRPPSRLEYRPPGSLQLTLLRPTRLFTALRPLSDLLARPGSAWAYIALLIAGAVAAGLNWPQVWHAVSEPPTWRTALAAAITMVVVTSLHEMGHGLALSHFGGTPRRLGVMLLYLTPALFCDVSDGWRMTERRHRVAVALAGPAVNLAAAALCALGLAFTSGSVSDFFALVGFGNLAGAVFNLLPFVKFDGYIALMSHVDVPFLRDRAMDDARAAAGRVVFGGRRERRLPARWSVPYGVGCLVLPILLVAWALHTYLPVLMPFGVPGAVIWLAVIAVALLLLLRGVARIARAARNTGASRARILAGALVVAAVVAAPLGLVRADKTVTAGFVTVTDVAQAPGARGASRIQFIHPSGGPDPGFGEGDRVELRRGGLIVRPVVATGTVGAGAPVEGTAPISAFVPLRDIGGRLAVLKYPLVVGGTGRRPITAFVPVPGRGGRLAVLNYPPAPTSTGPQLPAHGTATVVTGSQSLGSRIAETFLTPALQTLHR